MPASCARSMVTLPVEPLQEDPERCPVAKLLAPVGNNGISRRTAKRKYPRQGSNKCGILGRNGDSRITRHHTRHHGLGWPHACQPPGTSESHDSRRPGGLGEGPKRRVRRGVSSQHNLRSPSVVMVSLTVACLVVLLLSRGCDHTRIPIFPVFSSKRNRLVITVKFEWLRTRRQQKPHSQVLIFWANLAAKSPRLSAR